MLYVLLLSSREKLTNFLCVTKCNFTSKRPFCVFSPYEGLGATYHDHLRLIGKRVVDFLLVLTELFSLGVTAEALRENIGSKSAISLQRGPVDPKFQVERVAPTSHSSSQKTRLNDLSNGVKIWTDLTSVLSQSTRFDRQTDTFLIASPRWHSMHARKNCTQLYVSRCQLTANNNSAGSLVLSGYHRLHGDSVH